MAPFVVISQWKYSPQSTVLHVVPGGAMHNASPHASNAHSVPWGQARMPQLGNAFTFNG
jgi:hypothetical protein